MPLKKTILRFPIAILMFSALGSVDASDLVAVGDVEHTDTYRAAVKTLPVDVDSHIFPGQAFQLSSSNMVFAAGQLVHHSGKAECFVYLQPHHRPGSFHLLSEKAEDIWDCAGSPAVALMHFNLSGMPKIVLLSIFKYQSPSGEFFNLSLILDNLDSRDLKRGKIDKCVDKKLDDVKIISVKQLKSAATSCVQ